MSSRKIEIIQSRSIRLEASTVCQLKCPLCPTATGQTGKKLGAGVLKLSDFKYIVDKNPRISKIELSNWGEIFLNKDLLKIIKYAHKCNVALQAGNGVNLNNVSNEVLEGLVKYKFRKITCSIDGVSQETYSIYRVNGNFNQVIENIKTINKFKARYSSEFPIITWQFVVFGHNEHEITKARKMAEDLNMKFRAKLSWEDMYTKSFSPIKDAQLVRKETGLGVSTREEFRAKYGKEYVLRNCCSELWNSLQINYDGRVLGCPVNFWDDYGNAFKDGLKQCLNNEKIVYAKEMLMGKRESREDIPCAQCKVYKRMKENDDWITDKDTKKVYNKSKPAIMLQNNIPGYRLTKRVIKQLPAVKQLLRNIILIMQGKERKKKFGSPLAHRVYQLQIPLPPDEEIGWKPYPIFRGLTKGLQDLTCHVSVLTKGTCPHPPHMHKKEELLLLLTGEVDLTLPSIQVSDGSQYIHLQAGQFVYYPSNFAHTLQTTSQTPANYLMFKWYDVAKRKKSELAFGQFNMFPLVKDSEIKYGFTPRLVFEGPTAYLQKLHCHTSTLSPGAGYKPHSDLYDVAIVILEGEVETLGERAGPYSIIFYEAGKPHGMRNPGTAVAKYIVFEFHTR